jgi:hypothetical protein
MGRRNNGVTQSADRYLLGDAGLEVDEQTYVEAIAGMGVGP